MTRKILAGALVAFVAAPAGAYAHVTIQPNTAAAGGYTRLNVRVPNEKDDLGTVKVEVQLPPGFEAPSYEPVAGWEIETTASKVMITGDGEQGIIAPGQFRDFGLSLRVPEGKAGDKLTFKALQTYEGGEVVRWIGGPDSDEPAPQVTLTAATGGHGAAAGSHGAAGAKAAPAGSTATATVPEDDGHAEPLAIAALVVAGLGLLLGGAALARSRKRPATA